MAKKSKTKKSRSKPKSTLRVEWSNALPQKSKSKPQLKKHTKAKPKPPNPMERIKKLPLRKLQELQEFIDKLEKES